MVDGARGEIAECPVLPGGQARRLPYSPREVGATGAVYGSVWRLVSGVYRMTVREMLVVS
jgi:hypothetical protein